jgi:hypothetical protein
MSLINTHEHDGKWKEQLEEVLKHFPDGCQKIQNSIPEKFVARFTPQQQVFINMLMGDQGNFDSINNIDAKKLALLTFTKLLELSESPNYTEHEFTLIWNLTMEQITDIANGPCPQGRTTRIFQILYSLVSNGLGNYNVLGTSNGLETSKTLETVASTNA